MVAFDLLNLANNNNKEKTNYINVYPPKPKNKTKESRNYQQTPNISPWLIHFCKYFLEGLQILGNYLEGQDHRINICIKELVCLKCHSTINLLTWI